MRQLKVGLDFDGVIANSHPLKSLKAREMFGINIPDELFSREHVVGQNILDSDQYRSVGIRAMSDCQNIPPVKDAFFYIKTLVQEGHDLRIVTSRTEDMLEIAKNWMLINGSLSIPMVGTGYRLPKTEACKGLDVYIDDDLEKLVPMVGEVSNLLLFSWPWNVNEKEHSGIIRVSDWWDVYYYIRYEIKQQEVSCR